MNGGARGHWEGDQHTSKLCPAPCSLGSSEPPGVPLVGVAPVGVASCDATLNSALTEPVGRGDMMDGEEEGGGRDTGGDKVEGEGGMRLKSSISRME